MSNLEFKIIDDDYLDFIRAIEEKTPHTHYGSEKMKPFFGVLFEVNGLCYVSQISSGKQKHAAMKQSKTFIKLKTKGMQPHEIPIAVINLNYMFPVPKSALKPLLYSDILNNKNLLASDRSKYIALLKKEIELINNTKVVANSLWLYGLLETNSGHFCLKNCIDFKLLESKALEWKNKS